jgi:SPP1 family predicted phage head-tail adaptor
MGLAAGTLRHQVTIRQPYQNMATPAIDANRQPIEDWSVAVATGVWCSIEPLSASELYAAAQMRRQISHKVTMRYRPGMSALYRLEYLDPGTNALRIFSIDGTPRSPDEKRESLVMMVQERSA